MSSNSSFNAKDPPAGDAEASDPFSWGPMTDSSAGDAVSSADPVADVGSDGDEAATGDDPPNSPEPPPAESGAPTSAPDPFAALAAARLGESGSAEEKPSEEIPSSEEPLSEEPANDKPAEESEGTPSASEADADSAPFGMSPSAGGTSPFGSGKAETRPEPLGSSMTPPSPSSEKTPEPETPNEPETPKLASPPAESASPFGGETNDENASSHASSNLSPPTPHHTPRATRHAHSESPAPAGGEPPAPTKKTLDETTPATPPVALGGNGPGPSVLPALDDEASAAGGAGTIVTDAPASQYAAELTVEKKAPARAVLGKPVVYEIVVTNVGQRPAKEVTVSDVVPAGAKLQGTIPRAVMKQDRLTWKLGTLAVNESSSIRIKVIPTEPGTIGSVATVDFLTTTPPARTRVVEPKLSLSLTAPKTVPVGKIIAFDFEIANTGSAPARNVTLRNLLPSGFRHADGNDLEYEVGLLAPGAVQHVTLRAAAVKAGQFSNQAFLTGAGGLKTEAAATVQVIGKPLSLSRTGPQRRLVGREAVYTNTLQNNSSRQVGSATVIETIPPGMTFVSATGGGQFDHQQHRVVWNVGPLAPGEQTQLAVTLEATQQGTQRSTVRIEEINRGQSVQVTSATDVLVPEQLASTIGGPEETLVVGERTAFAIHLANGGAAPADHVLVSLTLPRQLKFVEARGGESSSSTPGVTTVHPSEPIPPGEEHRITFVVEAIAAGQNTLRASIDAAQLTTPLVREAEFQVVAARS